MRKPGVFVILLFFLLLISCEQKEMIKEVKESDDIYYSFKHPETGQEYQIVHAYKLYENYEEKMKEDETVRKSKLFKEEVIEQINDVCFREGEHFIKSGEIYSIHAPEDMEEIKDLIKIMDEKTINSAIKEALIKSTNYIPSKIKTNVCVFPTEADQNLPYMETLGTGKISVFYNNSYDENMLKVGTAHEYHHSVWTERHFQEEGLETVLDYLILEGKAVMIEKLVYPDMDGTVVYFNFNKELWKQIEPDLQKIDYSRTTQILNGGKQFPYSYGYSEGYNMVRTYLNKHPDLTPEEWTGLTSKEIYEKGNYIEHYQ